MDQKLAYIWLGSLGALLFIGFMIALANLSSHNYYQEQNYNNLPSLNEPAAIQDYKQAVKESVAATEIVNTGKSEVPINQTTNETKTFGNDVSRLLNPINQDGSLNWAAFVFWTVTLFFFYRPFRRMFRGWTY